MNSIRKKSVRKLLFLSLICLLALAAAMPASAVNPKWKQLRKKYAEKKNTNRLIFVKYEGGTNATLYMFRKKTRRNGTHYWKKFLKCKAYVGLNGLGKQREGDVKTPRGTSVCIPHFEKIGGDVFIVGRISKDAKWLKKTAAKKWRKQKVSEDAFADKGGTYKKDYDIPWTLL